MGDSPHVQEILFISIVLIVCMFLKDIFGIVINTVNKTQDDMDSP